MNILIDMTASVVHELEHQFGITRGSGYDSQCMQCRYSPYWHLSVVFLMFMNINQVFSLDPRYKLLDD